MIRDDANAATHSEKVAFNGVARGPRVIRINGRMRPAYEWCDMFGHYLVNGVCKTCGGLEDAAS